MTNAVDVPGLPPVTACQMTDILLDDQGSTTSQTTLQKVYNLFTATPLAPNIQSGASYTLQASDNGKVVVFTNSSAVTITLPQQSDVSLPVGFTCGIRTAGTGAGTFALEGSDTKSGNNGTGASATNDAVVLLRATVSTVNTWDIFGGV